MRNISRRILAAGNEDRIVLRDRAGLPHAAGSAAGQSGSRPTRARRVVLPNAGDRHADLVGRDYELQQVLDMIATRLAAIERLKSPDDYEEALAAIEAAAAPYVLAFFHEIAHLDHLIIERGRGPRHVR